MLITFLGHAGFCIETKESTIIVDPWLSPLGAFDSSWFQLPCNHHMAAFVHEKLQDCTKRRYIYISHEHKDHFDPIFLGGLQTSDFTFVIPHFRRTELYDLLQKYPSEQILRCADGEELSIPGGKIVLYLEDSEMDRDSAIFIQADGYSFLNLNDCKIHDRVADIVKKYGEVDVFTAQFSGAAWHPVCYDYPRKTYAAISAKKRISKFEAVARAIEAIRPRFYLASAGPPCFLDPTLQHINFEKTNIFPRAPLLLKYLEKRLKSHVSHCCDPMPGDTLAVDKGQWIILSAERLTDANFADYVHAYATRYAGYFAARQYIATNDERDQTLARLKVALQAKLQALTLRGRVHIPLYFRFADDEELMIRVDFENNSVHQALKIQERELYVLTTPSWEVARVLDGKLTWEDFTLTMRMKLNRDPDIYHVIIHGFLMMETEDMNWFCEKVLDAESNNERVLVEAGGRRYSLNRFCPHQGADLQKGWIEGNRFLVCPRHRWKFDLENKGNCTDCDASVRAFAVEDN